MSSWSSFTLCSIGADVLSVDVAGTSLGYLSPGNGELAAVAGVARRATGNGRLGRPVLRSLSFAVGVGIASWGICRALGLDSQSSALVLMVTALGVFGLGVWFDRQD
jgi:hypothetical protein